MAAGAYNIHCRATALCCSCLLGCLSFATLITVAVFRFNTIGSLTALSTMPIAIKDGLQSSDRTYSSDGSLILGLWITHLIFSCF